ncbi:hypothetical protein GCM10028784_33100 [Myceligenerans cantabricum]
MISKTTDGTRSHFSTRSAKNGAATAANVISASIIRLCSSTVHPRRPARAPRMLAATPPCHRSAARHPGAGLLP